MTHSNGLKPVVSGKGKLRTLGNSGLKWFKGERYRCGHKGEAIILDDNLLSITAYLEWKETVGFEGTNEMCFNCWCDKSKKEKAIPLSLPNNYENYNKHQ